MQRAKAMAAFALWFYKGKPYISAGQEKNISVSAIFKK
jgi:hypothetical protein